MAIEFTEIHRSWHRLQGVGNRALGPQGDAEFAREAVARSRRDDARAAPRRNASADATSLIVPSPPHAITSRAPRRTADLASSRAWPTASVISTSAGSPWASTTASASCARARAPRGLTPPEIGLMMMTVDTDGTLNSELELRTETEVEEVLRFDF
jgi:hypothetical protein